ncbi:MAG: hypothetical protein OXC19_15235 [Bryobacterales bacterium]|nr:hypothetical protein [Bryobacterales bacterium]
MERDGVSSCRGRGHGDPAQWQDGGPLDRALRARNCLEGLYLEGKRHGRWVSCFSGEGAWIEIWVDGTVVDGFRLIPPESICSGQIRGAYATARQERRRSELHLPPSRSVW